MFTSSNILHTKSTHQLVNAHSLHILRYISIKSFYMIVFLNSKWWDYGSSPGCLQLFFMQLNIKIV